MAAVVTTASPIVRWRCNGYSVSVHVLTGGISMGVVDIHVVGTLSEGTAMATAEVLFLREPTDAMSKVTV